MKEKKEKENILCLKQTALQPKASPPRGERGGGRRVKAYKNESGKIVVPPSQFMLNGRRRELNNRSTHLYITPEVEAIIKECANKLANDGCVINSVNKLLSVICATSQFEKLAQAIATEMLAERRKAGSKDMND